LEEYNDDTSEETFLREVERANDVAALAIATEPCVYERMFGRRRVTGLEPEDLGIGVDEYRALGSEARWERTREYQERDIEEHGRELAAYYRNAGGAGLVRGAREVVHRFREALQGQRRSEPAAARAGTGSFGHRRRRWGGAPGQDYGGDAAAVLRRGLRRGAARRRTSWASG